MIDHSPETPLLTPEERAHLDHLQSTHDDELRMEANDGDQ